MSPLKAENGTVMRCGRRGYPAVLQGNEWNGERVGRTTDVRRDRLKQRRGRLRQYKPKITWISTVIGDNINIAARLAVLPSPTGWISKTIANEISDHAACKELPPVSWVKGKDQ